MMNASAVPPKFHTLTTSKSPARIAGKMNMLRLDSAGPVQKGAQFFAHLRKIVSLVLQDNFIILSKKRVSIPVQEESFLALIIRI